MNLQPLSQAKTLGDWAYLGIQKHFQKILKHEPNVLQDRDPEELHQMRVGMRRLRSAVTGFAVAVDLPKAAADKQIGKIARSLGILRDIDVLQEALQNRYQPSLPKKERPIVKKVLAQLEKQRQKALKQVRATLKNKDYQKLKQALQGWLEKPNYREFARMPVEEVLPDLLLPGTSQLLLHPGWLLGANMNHSESDIPQNLTSQTVELLIAARGPVLHGLRKQAKRVRYQMSLFTDLYGSTYETYVEDMKQLQEVLGDIQDSLVLAEFLSNVLGSDLGTRAPKFAQLLVQNRYQAWQKWETLQHRYLSAHTRHAFRQELLQPMVDVSNNGSKHQEDKYVEAGN